MVPLLTFLNIQVQIYKGINEDNILNKNLSTLNTCQIEIGFSSQGCCLMGAWLPEVPTYDLPTGNQNFKQGPWADD